MTVVVVAVAVALAVVVVTVVVAVAVTSLRLIPSSFQSDVHRADPTALYCTVWKGTRFILKRQADISGCRAAATMTSCILAE